MAIVEDEVRNESEDENEIEVYVEDYDEQDSEDSDDDDDEQPREKRAQELEHIVINDPFNYDNHINLIQALWEMSELEAWQSAFERMYKFTRIRSEHWVMWLQTEVSLAHSVDASDRVIALFKKAALDCYSTSLLSDWCAFALSYDDADRARLELNEVLRRGGADPLSGKVLWDVKLEFEKSQLDSMRDKDESYKMQQERVLWALEEIVTRPLVHNMDCWPATEKLALTLHSKEYVDKLKSQHEAALEMLEKITPFEDKLLGIQDPIEKFEVYLDYTNCVIDMSRDDKYAECCTNEILRVLYDRASCECAGAGAARMLGRLARLSALASRDSGARLLDTCVRRAPRTHVFWVMKMQHAEQHNASFDEVKSIFETALSKEMDTFKSSDALWMGYLEFVRRETSFNRESDVERLRRTFRLAWDSIAECWCEEANDSEVPLFWARLEYQRMNDAKAGREIFDEIFQYGDNKSMSKYWEALIKLETQRSPPPADHKLRELMRRALRSVKDYPPAAAALWMDFERDHGHLHTLQECVDACESTLREWRETYQALKDKMMGRKQKGKYDNKKKFDYKKQKGDNKPKTQGKRKADNTEEETNVKRKKDSDTEEEEEEDEENQKTKNENEVEKEIEKEGGGAKRSHETDDEGETETKRQRTDSEADGETRLTGRDACTLFVSNLEFKVNEQNLRNNLSQYGDIVSLRVRSGVKAFGGSICYCQFKTPESVDEALKHDRSPLDGRPMFFSRYAAKKTKPIFKYSTTVEKNKLFVRNLPFVTCTKQALENIFDKYGKLVDVRIVTHKDGRPKGIAYIEYADDKSAAEALEKTNGLLVGERNIEVALSAPPPRAQPGAVPTLGQAKRETAGRMHRTQLSTFIPSVLQKASTSKAPANGSGSSSDNKRPLSNSDFRNMLLNK